MLVMVMREFLFLPCKAVSGILELSVSESGANDDFCRFASLLTETAAEQWSDNLAVCYLCAES